MATRTVPTLSVFKPTPRVAERGRKLGTVALTGRRKRYLIPGPVLIGFAEFFDRSYGDPTTPKTPDGDYPTITPSSFNGLLLPFSCMYCEGTIVVTPRNVANYTDTDRGFSWCPSCKGRYVLDPNGQPLDEDLPADAPYAPATVTADDETSIIGKLKKKKDGLTLLGAL